MLKRFIVSLMAVVVGVVAFAPPAHAALQYYYATGQWGWSSGSVPVSAAANITVWKPSLAVADYHTLAALAVTSANEKSNVEVGWTVDPILNGNSEPHLYIHWYRDVAGVKTGCGYNGQTPNSCGITNPWVDNPAAGVLNAGDELTESTSGGTTITLKVGIDYNSTDCGAAPNGWWVRAWYSTGTSAYIGCYKDTNWSGVSPTFTDIHQVKTYGEAAVNSASSSTQMGSGVCPAAVPVFNTTAFIGSVQTNLGLTTLTYSNTDPTHFKYKDVSTSSFYYGGDNASVAC